MQIHTPASWGRAGVPHGRRDPDLLQAPPTQFPPLPSAAKRARRQAALEDDEAPFPTTAAAAAAAAAVEVVVVGRAKAEKGRTGGGEAKESLEAVRDLDYDEEDAMSDSEEELEEGDVDGDESQDDDDDDDDDKAEEKDGEEEEVEDQGPGPVWVLPVRDARSEGASHRLQTAAKGHRLVVVATNAETHDHSWSHLCKHVHSFIHSPMNGTTAVKICPSGRSFLISLTKTV